MTLIEWPREHVVINALNLTQLSNDGWVFLFLSNYNGAAITLKFKGAYLSAFGLRLYSNSKRRGYNRLVHYDPANNA